MSCALRAHNLSDVEYAIAARLHLGLQPFPPRAMAALPEHCPLCVHRVTGAPVSLRDDPWHSLTCPNLVPGELSRRHDAVVDAIGRIAWQVGAQVRREVEGLNPLNNQRPDLHIVFPGRVLLTDVAVSHALTANHVTRGKTVTVLMQTRKDRKYAGIAARLGAELLNVSVDACGGMAGDAFELVRAVGEEGARWSAGAWHSGAIERQMLGGIAMAVQRGNALTMLCGYTRATAADARIRLGNQMGVDVDGDAGEETATE